MAWVGGLCEVPEPWRTRLGFDYAASGGEPEGGGSKHTSAGPALTLFDAEAPGSAEVVVYHPPSRPARVGYSRCATPRMDHCSTSTWEDVVWLEDVVLLFGTACDSTSFYSDEDCGGACCENKGQVCHGRYVASALLFNPAELGRRDPGAVEPYAVLEMPWMSRCQPGVGGAAEMGGLIYVVERREGAVPTVHVIART